MRVWGILWYFQELLRRDIALVEVKYIGRLGNNLFQYCFGRIIAEKLGFKLKADSIPGFPNTRAEIDGKDYSSFPAQIIKGHVVDLENILRDQTKRKIALKGFFQRYEYYKERKSIIKNDWLATDKKIVEKPNVNDIVIHIRRGDFVKKNSALPFSFYKKILGMSQYDRVIICTDKPQDPFLLLFKKYKPIIRSQKNNPLEDFIYIMSANKIIQSPSSFSWWASFLSKAEEIYTPIPLEGYWSKNRDDTNLVVNDEKRYIYIECNEKYEESFVEKYAKRKRKIIRYIQKALDVILHKKEMR